MVLSAVQSQVQVVSSVRAVQQIRISIQVGRLYLKHRFCRSESGCDILHVSPLHDERLVCQCRHICEIGFHLVSFYLLFECLASRTDIRFRYPCRHEIFQGTVQFILCVLKLKVQELLHRPDRSLLRFDPARSVIAYIVCGCGILQFLPVLPCEDLRLSDIRVVIRL